ncbi:uncharacterized protein N7506_000227 [Penicillium brevicompactum]|uniref:uncharacterized protein n=1 Tax=Penicillium brevicompactum TaxID=5074 RepID=UPI0025418F7D|nr:uncharacterized protein N7506_000227 [Penicillium brevicompactum]KAJ5346974.1 hypothetical protein N7506_000227 [Penicillium brevicompactum]
MQADAGRRESRPEPLSESEKRHFSKYGKFSHRKLVDFEGRATLSCGDNARSATVSDAIQPREASLRQDRSSRSGTPVFNADSLHNGAVGDAYRKLSTTEKRLLQPTKSSVQDATIKEQRVKFVSEEDASVLFPFD